MITRRQFLTNASVAAAAVATADLSFARFAPEKGRFAISLAEWSLHRALFSEPSPAPIKAALALKGLCRTSVRLPLVEATQACRDSLAALIKAYEAK